MRLLFVLGVALAALGPAAYSTDTRTTSEPPNPYIKTAVLVERSNAVIDVKLSTFLVGGILLLLF